MARNRDINFFTIKGVSSTTYDENDYVSWNFNSRGFSFMLETDEPTDVIYYSFDGINDHGDMIPFMPNEAIIWDGRSQCKVWFRRETPGGEVKVRVEAWRYES